MTTSSTSAPLVLLTATTNKRMAYKKNGNEHGENGSGVRRSRAVLLSEVDTPHTPASGKKLGPVVSPAAPREDGIESCGVAPVLGRCKKSAPAERAVSEACSEGAGYAVLDVHPDGEGAFVVVVLSCPGKEDPSGGERVTARLLVEQYAELSPKQGNLTSEQADALISAGRLAEAVRRAASLLQYGDLSERRLAYKLTTKGIDRADAEAAVAYLVAKGMMAEDRGAVRRAEQDVRKLWGPRRIREDLRAQGYEGEAIEAAMLALDDREVDFVQSCATVIRRKWGGVPTDRATRAKYRAALLSLGFESDTVREAERLILDDED